FAVGSVERVGDFDRQGEQTIKLHRSLNQVLQSFATEALHHDEQMSVVLANFVDGADVGVVQGRSGTGLAPKALESLGVLGRIVGEEFQRDKSAEKSVFGLVNYAHPTATEQFENPVMGNGL